MHDEGAGATWCAQAIHKPGRLSGTRACSSHGMYYASPILVTSLCLRDVRGRIL